MRFRTSLLALLSILLSFALAAAQDVRPEPTPPVMSIFLGPTLMTWTEFQKPQPIAESPAAPKMEATGPNQILSERQDSPLTAFQSRASSGQVQVNCLPASPAQLDVAGQPKH